MVAAPLGPGLTRVVLLERVTLHAILAVLTLGVPPAVVRGGEAPLLLEVVGLAPEADVVLLAILLPLAFDARLTVRKQL